MFVKLSRLISIIVLTTVPLASVIDFGVAHAAGPPSQPACTDTWTGTTSSDWTVGSNWSTSVAPASSDVVCIDNSNTGTASGVITNVSGTVDSIVFENDTISGGVILQLGGGLTVNTNIYQATSDTATTDSIGGFTADETITLGGNLAVVTSNGGGIDLENAGSGFTDNLALGANTLTFYDQGGTSIGTTDDIADIIGGTGSIVFDSPATDYVISGDSTYNGTTTLTSTADLGVLADNQFNAFGTSTITVDPYASLEFLNDNPTSGSISNPIIIEGYSTGNSAAADLEFDNESATTGLTFTVPNITLNGDATFENDSGVSNLATIDLAGLTANGHCLYYINGLGSSSNFDAASADFTNAPTECTGTITSGGSSPSSGGGPSAPKTPDTGLAATSANPWSILTISLGTSVILLGLAFRFEPGRVKQLFRNK